MSRNILPLVKCGWLKPRSRSLPPALRNCFGWENPLSSGSGSGHQVRHYWPVRRYGDPFYEIEKAMDRFIRDFDRMPFFRPWSLLGRNVPVETIQDGKRLYKIELDLPDFKPEEIQVTVKDNLVTVRAKHQGEKDGVKQHREYHYQYTLPQDVNPEHIKSLINSNGLLTIEAPLPELKEPESKEIPVQCEKSN